MTFARCWSCNVELDGTAGRNGHYPGPGCEKCGRAPRRYDITTTPLADAKAAKKRRANPNRRMPGLSWSWAPPAAKDDE